MKVIEHYNGGVIHVVTTTANKSTVDTIVEKATDVDDEFVPLRKSCDYVDK